MTDSAVVKPENILSSNDLADVNSWDEALALLERAGIGIQSSTDFGDGFLVLPKETFVNVPLMILDFKFAEGDYVVDGVKQEFAIARVMTRDGRKGVITDGGSGIYQQLRRVAEKGKRGGIYVEKGLVVSEYDYEDEKGNVSVAKTFYISGM